MTGYRTLAALTIAVIAVISGSVSTATAATEFGNHCAVASGSPATIWQKVDAPTDPPSASPASGVLTKWGTNMALAAPTVPVKIKVIRPTPTPGAWSVVGAGETNSVLAGDNVFAVRIPIAIGDRLAMYSTLGALFCAPATAGDLVGADGVSGDVAPGGTVTESTSGNYRLAAWGVVEPDADGDGFGDESQDLCPRSATYQTACPVIKLSRVLLPPGPRSLLMYVASETTVPVEFTASARVPAGAGKRARTIRFKGRTRTVSPGVLARIELKYPKALSSAVKSLPRSAKIKVTLKVKATGLVNTDSKTYLITLRGRL